MPKIFPAQLKVLMTFFNMQKEWFSKISSFRALIDSIAPSAPDCFEYLKDKIPSSQWADTPLELKATAGLRLLKRMLYHCVAIICEFCIYIIFSWTSRRYLGWCSKITQRFAFQRFVLKKNDFMAILWKKIKKNISEEKLLFIMFC